MTVHIVNGRPKTSGKRRKPASTVTYPPGHFTRGITSSTFLVGWVPSSSGKVNSGSTLGGHKAVETGTAFGGRVTMDLPKTPHGNKPPGRMRTS
ncbi:MAG: hypothetical protein JNN18_09445 [Rubrivivax sp.]|nr:hypothetical protein [Rubrivivax sp.]